MFLPIPHKLSDPIPNPSPAIPNTPPEHVVKGPYWDMLLAAGQLDISLDGEFERTGSGTSYPTADTALVKTNVGYAQVGNGLSVVGGNVLQVGTGGGALQYNIQTQQGPMPLGSGFYVNSTSGNLELD